MKLKGYAKPYTELYIYYVEGYLSSRPAAFDKTFIGTWEEDGFSFLFFSEPADREVEKVVGDNPTLTLLDRYHMSYDDWQGAALQPFRVGNLLIAPPWETITPQTGDVPILLDPGVVFGTGTHTTTHDCLESIVIACYKRRISTAVDLGTGTGLLAIAAAKMGCRKVLAVDLNPLAVQTARKNIALNQLNDRILAVRGKAEECLMHSADLLIANIHYEVMQGIIASDTFLNHKMFVLSGLMRSQARLVEEQLARYPVSIIHTWQRGNIWHTFFGKVDTH